MSEQTMMHALKRTSPKGGPFIGQCTKCGVRDIPLKRIGEECANPANITKDEALMRAILSDHATTEGE